MWRRVDGWPGAIAWAAFATVLAASAGEPALAQEPSDSSLHRGPLESRDQWLLAQPVLTLPAMAPDPLPRGRTEVFADGDWGSDFGWVSSNDAPSGERSAAGTKVDRGLRFLVDGEHRSAFVLIRHGVGAGMDLGIRVGVLWRGPGLMDGFIDRFHTTLALPDSGRSQFPAGRLRVEGRDHDRQPLAWSGHGGAGLGNLELELRRAVLGSATTALARGPGAALPIASGPAPSAPADMGWRAAVVVRGSLPSATGAFAGAGGAAGLQFVCARALGSRVEGYGGLGATVHARDRLDGLEYRRVRPEGFLAVEALVTPSLSLVAQVDAAGRLVTSIDEYPGVQGYLRLAMRLAVGRWTLEGGFTEGVVSQEAATDFGLLAALSRRF